MELTGDGSLGSRTATTPPGAVAAGQLCGAATDLTDEEIVSIIRVAIAPGPIMTDDALGSLRLGAVCDLSEGHAGSHASLQALGGQNGDPVPWLRWGDGPREIMWSDLDCPHTEPMNGVRFTAGGAVLLELDENTCDLFAGHPGEHHLWDWDGTGVAPSWSLHACQAGNGDS